MTWPEALPASRPLLAARFEPWLTLARISNSPTVASNVLAGCALAGIAAPDGRVARLALALVAFYTAGMALNDLCDRAWDRRMRPERPLASGAISARAAGAAVLVLLLGGELLLASVSAEAALAGGALVALIVAYDAWHKGNPLSPLVMGGTRALCYVVAFAGIAAARPSREVLAAAAVLGLYTAALTTLARAEGTRSGPSTPLSWLSGAVLVAAPAAWAVLHGGPTDLLVVLGVALAAWTVAALALVLGRERPAVGTAVTRVIAGMALFDAVVIAATEGGSSLLSLALVAFAATLVLQRFVKGT